MSSEDHAVVIGISHYPGLGEDPKQAANLEAPDADASAVRDWLVDPAGGAVPKGNVYLVRSRDFARTTNVVNAKPQQGEITATFSSLDDLAQDNRRQGKGLKVGRRLYIYVSGHGYAPKRYEGCLFTANATRLRTHNIYASGWLEWFQDMGYFDEYVLWMDCCMDRELTVLPEATFRMQGVPSPPGPTFIAFAAPRPLKTVERKISADSDRIHSVFTWTLLEGLRGAAADPETGQVTGRTLGDYLFNAMKGHLNPDDLAKPDIAKEPEVVKADARLVFVVNLRPSYQVRLTFPDVARGKVARLWAGNPPAARAPIPIDGLKIDAQLDRGLYLVDVPDVGLRQGFEVTGSGRVEAAIRARGPAVVSADAGATFDLAVDLNNPAAEIFIIDHHFALVTRGRSRLVVGQPFGLYKVKARIGREVVEQVILLDRDRPDVGLTSPAVASPVPAYGTSLVHEYHEAAARELPLNVHVRAGAGAEVFLMARMWTRQGATAQDVKPWEGITLVDHKGKQVANLGVHGERYTAGDTFRNWRVEDPFAACTVAVTPGIYFLRQRLSDRRVFEQSLIASAGWRLEAFLLQLTGSDETAPMTGRDLSLLMHRIATQSLMGESVLLETARVALADERRILNPDLEQLLFMKLDNPIAGLVGAHLLLLDPEWAGSPDKRRLLDQVVTNLRVLVGDNHPDVEAISLRCQDATRRASRPFREPPMFARSWQLIVEATANRAELVPDELWQRIHATTAVAPYLVWASDAPSRAAHRQQLKAWVAGSAGAVSRPSVPQPEAGLDLPPSGPAAAIPSAIAPAQPGTEIRAQARKMQIPDAALDTLWRARSKSKES